MYPEVLHIIREYIKLRYQLIPYMYSLIVEASRTGHPITRPLGNSLTPSKRELIDDAVYQFSEDVNVADTSFDYLLGPYMLIASIYKEGTSWFTKPNPSF